MLLSVPFRQVQMVFNLDLHSVKHIFSYGPNLKSNIRSFVDLESSLNLLSIESLNLNSKAPILKNVSKNLVNGFTVRKMFPHEGLGY